MNVQSAVLVVHPTSKLKGTSVNPVVANFFLWSSFFIMNKEVRARSYGAQPLIDRMKHAPACTTGQILLLIYYIAGNFVDQLIHTKKARH